MIQQFVPGKQLLLSRLGQPEWAITDFRISAACQKPLAKHRAQHNAHITLLRGGERVGLTGADVPPRRGEVQLLRLAAGLLSIGGGSTDYGAPEITGMLSKSRALYISDFMGPLEPLEAALTAAADRGVRGALLQVLDPEEEAFPYDGRTVFESMGGRLQHETLQAGALRDRYLQRLAERKDRLAELARITGWQVDCHHTGESAQAALMWLFGALEKVR